MSYQHDHLRAPLLILLIGAGFGGVMSHKRCTAAFAAVHESVVGTTLRNVGLMSAFGGKADVTT
jgi:hypothetical protein